MYTMFPENLRETAHANSKRALELSQKLFEFNTTQLSRLEKSARAGAEDSWKLGRDSYEAAIKLTLDLQKTLVDQLEVATKADA